MTDIEKILKTHMEWLNSKGKKGERADFRRENLKSLDLPAYEKCAFLELGAIFNAEDTLACVSHISLKNQMLIDRIKDAGN